MRLEPRFVSTLLGVGRHLVLALLAGKVLGEGERLEPLLHHEAAQRRATSVVAADADADAAVRARDGSVLLLRRLQMLDREEVHVLGVDRVEEERVLLQDGLGDGVHLDDSETLVGRSEGEDLGEQVAEGDLEGAELVRRVNVEGWDRTVARGEGGKGAEVA